MATPDTSGQGSAPAYVRATLELLGDRDPRHVLEHAPHELAKVLEGLGDAFAARPEREGGWSLLQTVRHWVDSELVWAVRLRKTIAEDRPTLQGYDQDLWVRRLRHADGNVRQALEEFLVVRAINLRFLDGRTPEELQRVAVHSERGEETVAHMIRLYAGHDLVHLRQVRRIRAAVEGAQAGAGDAG